MAEFTAFIKDKKFGLVLPVLLELSFRILKQVKAESPDDLLAFKNLVAGFVVETIRQI